MSGTISGYRLSPRARADLEEIWRYTLKTWSIEQADIYHRKLVGALDALAAETRSDRNVDNIRTGYLKYSVGSHFIFYRWSDAGIEIIRVLHQRMNIENHI